MRQARVGALSSLLDVEKPKDYVFSYLTLLLNVEKTKDNDFFNLTLLLSSLHEVEKPNYDVLSNFPLFSKWKDKGELFFPASANGHPEGPASCK